MLTCWVENIWNEDDKYLTSYKIWQLRIHLILYWMVRLYTQYQMCSSTDRARRCLPLEIERNGCFLRHLTVVRNPTCSIKMKLSHNIRQFSAFKYLTDGNKFNIGSNPIHICVETFHLTLQTGETRWFSVNNAKKSATDSRVSGITKIT